jgi:hypothetical protein
MSGSPKYTYVDPGEERRRQAELARQERERRRREEEARARAAALDVAQRSAKSRIRAVADQIERLRREAVAVGSELLAEVDGLRSQLTRDESAVDSGRDAGSVNQTLRHVEQLRRDCSDLRARVLTPARREVTARVDALVEMLGDIDLSERVAIDRAGADEADRLLSEARRYARTDPIGTSARVDRLAATVTRHLGVVLAHRAQQEEDRREAERVVGELQHSLSVLVGDATAVGVTFDQQHGLQGDIAALSALVERGEHAEAVHQAGAVGGRIAVAETELDIAIQQLNERRELMRAVVDALPDLGFEPDPQSLAETADGALGLRAYRSDGEEFAVVMTPGEGGQTEVSYTTGSMLYEGEGSDTAAHASLVDIIAALGEHTRQKGFATGPVHWDPPGATRRPGDKVMKRRH